MQQVLTVIFLSLISSIIGSEESDEELDQDLESEEEEEALAISEHFDEDSVPSEFTTEDQIIYGALSLCIVILIIINLQIMCQEKQKEEEGEYETTVGNLEIDLEISSCEEN